MIFLDDLQWADSASLKLIELMTTDNNTGYLLLLGAYRDNEVSPNHPLMLTVERLQQQGVLINSITLAPLKLEEIMQLIADTIHSDQETVKPLAELVFQKTSGNPFFINEFLRTIYQENILTFDRQEKQWLWNIAQIEALGITENVVDLMLGKLRKLPENTQKGLRLAACIGNSFDLNTLSIIFEKSPPETFKDILAAIQLGLIYPISALEPTSEAPIESTLVILNYRFLHDRVQQAAYALIEDLQKQAVHLQIGRLLLANLSPEEREEKIFTLVDHLNQGRELIESNTEKIELAKLNLYAGKKAKESTAYNASRSYLIISKDEFPGNIWEKAYEMALDLYKDLAEVEYLIGNFEQSQSLIEMSLKQTKSAFDCTEFHLLRINQYTLTGRYSEAVESGRIALKSLDTDLATHNYRAAFEAEIADYRRNFGNQKISSLYDHSETEIPEKKAVLRILTRIAPTAWILDPELMYLVGTKIAHLNIQYGNTERSVVGYSYLGVIHTYVLQDYLSGYEYGALSVKLSDKYQNLISKTVTSQLHGSITMPWVEHIKHCESVNAQGFDAGFRSGDLQMVGYSYTYNLYNLIYQGRNIDLLLKEVSRGLLFSQETQNQWSINCILGAKILIHNLMGLTKDKFCFDIEETDESNFLESCRINKTLAAICFYSIFKAQVLYLYGEPMDLHQLQEVKKLFDYIPGTISIATHNFYYSLTLANLYPQASSIEQDKYWRQLLVNQQQMQTWANNCPENFLHKYFLVAAEISRISGEWYQAIDLYDQAIELARENEFIQDEALSNELAAQFWWTRGKEEFARLYIRKAYQCYQIWGAQRKVEELNEKYPQWLGANSSEYKKTLTNISTTTTSSGEALDLATVLKATQTISGEIVLSKLLQNLMKTVMENAGAQKGFLILEQEGSLVIEAKGTVEENDVTVLQSIPIDYLDVESQIPLVSTAIINYVARSQENVVLNNAVHEGSFTRDPYILTTQPKSILCAPLLNQGKLSGILYLENDLTTGAFTLERLQILNILSSQAAISIENSRLYTTLEQKVGERTQELSQTLEILKATQAKLEFENALLKSADSDSDYDYQVGGSLSIDSPTYVVRSADRYLYKALKTGEFCYILNTRQMGKSSLMVRMMHHLKQEGFCCVAIDMTRLGSENITPDQWYKGLAVELWQSFDLFGKVNLKAWWQEKLDLSPVQRLSRFFEEVLLKEVKLPDGTPAPQIIIFFDEIDSVLGLDFSVNDFFALIRFCYNQRTINSEFKRLCFALFGVATPNDLITDYRRTPFNIGQGIQLHGFQLHEAQPLLYGLTDKVSNPQALLKEVLFWTNGQPFLTQKICQMIRRYSSSIPERTEKAWVENLIRTNIINSWESQDEPEHLRTIRDRILKSEQPVMQMLEFYGQVLDQGQVSSVDSLVERELLLSGLLIKQQGDLKIHNRIYELIFNSDWIAMQML